MPGKRHRPLTKLSHCIALLILQDQLHIPVPQFLSLQYGVKQVCILAAVLTVVSHDTWRILIAVLVSKRPLYMTDASVLRFS